MIFAYESCFIKEVQSNENIFEGVMADLSLIAVITSIGIIFAGFYQPAGPLIQTMPHDPCCIPEHMAMLVPRPQVKVLVHNTGSYPATNPYAALPDSSQPPIIPTKGSGTHHMRSNSSELKEKSQNTASPTKRTKTAKELDHDKCEVMADARKENDDGKVFTTLEVAKKQLKNIDGRELLAQRTKLSSDPLLLQPIISERSSNSVHSEDKTNTEGSHI